MSASRLLLVVALALAPACGTAPDERQPTFDVVTLEVLAPTCGQVQCHSSATHLKGYPLDTLDNARAAMQAGLLEPDGHGNDPRPQLLYVINTTGGDRMPPDSPLAHEDIALVQAWFDAGTPGL